MSASCPWSSPSYGYWVWSVAFVCFIDVLFQHCTSSIQIGFRSSQWPLLSLYLRQKPYSVHDWCYLPFYQPLWASEGYLGHQVFDGADYWSRWLRWLAKATYSFGSPALSCTALCVDPVGNWSFSSPCPRNQTRGWTRRSWRGIFTGAVGLPYWHREACWSAPWYRCLVQHCLTKGLRWSFGAVETDSTSSLGLKKLSAAPYQLDRRLRSYSGCDCVRDGCHGLVPWAT